MPNRSRGGRPQPDNSPSKQDEETETEYGETDRTQKDAIGGDRGYESDGSTVGQDTPEVEKEPQQKSSSPR